MCNHSQVAFCQKWADDILQSCKPMRQRKPAALSISNTNSTNASALCTPASSHISRLAEHELVDMSYVARAAYAQKNCRQGRRKPSRMLSVSKGTCHYQECPVLQKGYKGPLPKLTHYRCPSCKDGNGAFYHIGCFFHVHRCVLEK